MIESVAARAYAGARDHECINCGAAVGDYCTRTNDFGDVFIRRVPCIARVDAGAIQIPGDEPPSSIDFGEPRHPREDQR